MGMNCENCGVEIEDIDTDQIDGVCLGCCRVIGIDYYEMWWEMGESTEEIVKDLDTDITEEKYPYLKLDCECRYILYKDGGVDVSLCNEHSQEFREKNNIKGD